MKLSPSSTFQTGSASSTGDNAGKSKRLAAFPYRGGKFHLAPKLVKLLPSHRIYVEVFGGAASVLLAKPPSPIEVYNDRDGALVNLFETVRNHPLLFLERCQFLLYSRELYASWSRQLDDNFQGADIDRIEAAVRTYYCMVSSFVGDPTKGWAFDRSSPGGGKGGPMRWMSVWRKIGYLSERLRHVAIDCLDFRDCIRNWDTEQTVFFCDPPYPSSVSTGFYGHDFPWEDHVELARTLRNAKGKWLVTYDDISEIRDLYKGFQTINVSSVLSSQKVPEGGSRVKLRQIVIANYDDAQEIGERGWG